MAGPFEAAQAGWDAYDSSGEKIGGIHQVGSNYLLVSKGLLLPKDLYIPREYVEDVDPGHEAVTLRVRKDQVEDMGWDEPPRATATGTPSRTDTTASRAAGGATTDVEGDMTIPLREERLETERRKTQAGEVTLGKRVVEQEEEVDVPVTRDEVQVTRRRVDRPAGESDTAYAQGDTIRVPVSAEEVEVRKEPRVVEEVEISKRPVTETRHVSESVRREELDVDETGNVLAESGTQAMSGTDLDDAGTAGLGRGQRARDDAMRDKTTYGDEDPG